MQSLLFSQRSLQVLAGGLFIMINWLSLLSLVTRVPVLLSDIDESQPREYDWILGVFQYSIGLFVTLFALVAIDGANLSLLSKLSPQRIRSVVVNAGTLSTFLTLLARLAADLHILVVDLSHKLINNDIVNSVVIPLFLLCFLLRYFVRKHYFFLI
jgi:hypothetical protein